MPQVVQNQDGKFFVDEGGGVYRPVTEEQARVADRAMRQGALVSTGDAALQGAANLASGAVNVANDMVGRDDPYWQDKLKTGRQYSQALQSVNPVGETLGAAVPQVAGGIAGAAVAPEGLLGAGIVGGLEAVMGAAANPENPGQGALLGGLAGAAGQAAPMLARSAFQRGRSAWDGLSFGRASPLEEVPLNPGGYAAGERASLDELDAVRNPPSNSAAASNPASQTPPDLSAPLRTPINDDLSTAAGGAPRVPGQPSDVPFDSALGPAPAAPAAPPPNMAQRVTQTLAQADEATGGDVANARALQGLMSPEELYVRGVPTSQGQRMLLNSTTAGGEAELNAAQRMLSREEAMLSHPVMGEKGTQIRAAQKASASNFIARELGVPKGYQLTEDMLSTQFGDIGHRLDDIAESVGNVPITQAVNNDLDEVLKYTLGRHKGLVEGIVKEVRDRAELNGGALSGQDWQGIRTQIGKMMNRGQKSGDINMITDAGELMDTLTKTMEGQLDTGTRLELEQLRKQYRIALTLSKPGVRDVDGGVNAGAFYRNWKQGQSRKATGKDPIGVFMNTINTLTKQRIPNSGTADRVLMALSDTANMIPGVKVLRGIAGK